MEKIVGIIREIRPDLDFTNAENVSLDGAFDSLDLIRLIHELETNYKINIAPSDINPENFKSLNSIDELINRSAPKN